MFFSTVSSSFKRFECVIQKQEDLKKIAEYLSDLKKIADILRNPKK